MKEKIKTFFCVCLLMVALPLIITMMLQNQDESNRKSEKSIFSMIFEEEEKSDENKEADDTEKKNDNKDIDVEALLPGIVAKEMPAVYETEALKAQAVVARTNLQSAVEKGEELPTALSQEELLDMWGSEGFTKNYEKITDAVSQTEGKLITYQDKYVYAAYHAVSAGKTRNAKEGFGYEEMPWLEAVESSSDIPSPDFLKVLFLKPESVKEKLTAAFGEVAFPEEGLVKFINIQKRDGSEYVTQIQMGDQTITGEEFRSALGLNSACFYIAEVEGNIRFVTKGLGHGLGLSQYGANEMAKEGKSWQDILNKYFKNIKITD